MLKQTQQAASKNFFLHVSHYKLEFKNLSPIPKLIDGYVGQIDANLAHHGLPFPEHITPSNTQFLGFPCALPMLYRDLATLDSAGDLGRKHNESVW